MQYKIKKTAVLAVLSCILAGVYAVSVLAAEDKENIPEQGSLTIHKYGLVDMEFIGSPGNGSSEEVHESAVPLEGITFTLWQVDESERIPDTITVAADQLMADTKQSVKTDREGIAYFELKAGLYYIAETDATGIDGSSYAPCDPFLVSLPMRSASGDRWITDVHVYPKNQRIAIDKYVNGPGMDIPDLSDREAAKTRPVAAREPFGWTIASAVPFGIGDTMGEQYIILSILPEGVDYFRGSGRIYLMSADMSDLSEAYLLDREKHYITDFSEEEKTLTIELTEDGIHAVANWYEKNNETVVLIKYDCIVEDDAPQGIDLYADAEVIYKRILADGMVVLTAEVQEQPAVHTGQMEIFKLDALDKTKGLEDARFGISIGEENARDGIFVAEGTTDQKGQLIIKGLKYGREGDYSAENSIEETYWITEIEAPEKYIGLKEPVELEFYHQRDEQTGQYYFARVKVYNTPENVPPADPETKKPGDERGKDGAQGGASGKGGSVRTSDAVSLLFFITSMGMSMTALISLSLYKKRSGK